MLEAFLGQWVSRNRGAGLKLGLSVAIGGEVWGLGFRVEGLGSFLLLLVAPFRLAVGK